jgi:hypothetical protein
MKISYPRFSRAAGLLLVSLIAGRNIGYTEEWRQVNSPTAEYALSASARAHKTTVGSITLQIDDCELRVQSDQFNAVYEMKLPSACRFVVGKGGDPQIVETGPGPTLLVVSSAPLADSRLCDTRVRAVVVQNNYVLISQDEQRMRSCARGPFDTKMFHVLARSAKAP